MSAEAVVCRIAERYEQRPAAIRRLAVLFALSSGHNFLDFVAESTGRPFDELNDPTTEELVEAMLAAVPPWHALAHQPTHH